MSDTREEIVRRIDEHRVAIARLEAELRPATVAPWPPEGFYFTFYVVSGTILGILGSLTSFLFNVVGSLVVNQDPLRFLRVYGTFFLGARALTTDDLNFFMLVAVVHFSVGAAAGAVFHVLVNRFVPERPLLHVLLGALYGLLMWVVNFYGVITWLQPRLVGQAYVLALMPAWVAILTHLVYGLTLGLLQPLGRFIAYRPATVVALVALVATASRAGAADPTPLEREGAQVYARYCVGCHGEKGDGNGPAAAMLIVKPRDFTKGIFKFRTTPSGSLPTDADLERTLLHGIGTTSMPEWSLLSGRDRSALVAYVKSFYPDWSTRGTGRAIAIPSAPPWVGSPEAIARGRVLYQELLGCPSCHGEAGRGDGPSAATMGPDTWGNPQRPANFTRGIYKSGRRPEDIYRTFMTGIDGTAMPSYYDIFAEPDGESILADDAWRLVSYVLSFRATRKEGAQ